MGNVVIGFEGGQVKRAGSVGKQFGTQNCLYPDAAAWRLNFDVVIKNLGHLLLFIAKLICSYIVRL